MKKTLVVIAVAVGIGALGFFSGSYFSKPASKPVVSDTTLLKAEFQVREWNGILAAIVNQGVKLKAVKDTVEQRKAVDTIQMAINTIGININDPARNPVLKK